MTSTSFVPHTSDPDGRLPSLTTPSQACVSSRLQVSFSKQSALSSSLGPPYSVRQCLQKDSHVSVSRKTITPVLPERQSRQCLEKASTRCSFDTTTTTVPQSVLHDYHCNGESEFLYCPLATNVKPLRDPRRLLCNV